MKNVKVKKHFLNPLNMGSLENPTHQSIIKSGKCNDLVKMMAVIRNGIVEEIRTEVFGCGYSIAGASIVTEIIKGKSIDGIIGIVESELKTFINDIPESNRSCIALSLDAFKKIHAQLGKEQP